MKKVLVDSSVWINYFKSKNLHNDLTELIMNNQICTNNLILSELIPSLKMKKEDTIIDLLLEIPKKEIDINWDLIINIQIQNLKNGVNRVGIPDLIILNNVISDNLILYSNDKHFRLMNNFINFELYEEK